MVVVVVGENASMGRISAGVSTARRCSVNISLVREKYASCKRLSQRKRKRFLPDVGPVDTS